MKLFTINEPGKEILNNDHVILSLKSNGKYTIEVDSNCIKVTQKGVKNMLIKGLSGTKTYPFSSLTSIQFKEPGFTTGYLQFILMGSVENKHGVSGAVNDENTILFVKKELPLMLELKEYIEFKINTKAADNNVDNRAYSEADEILKYKKLLDAGILTQEEFDAKKKQLLGL